MRRVSGVQRRRVCSGLRYGSAILVYIYWFRNLAHVDLSVAFSLARVNA